MLTLCHETSDCIEVGRLHAFTSAGAVASTQYNRRLLLSLTANHIHPHIDPPQDVSPDAAVRRTRPSGIYTSLLLGDTGPGGKPIGVVLLDERWGRTFSLRVANIYPGSDGQY